MYGKVLLVLSLAFCLSACGGPSKADDRLLSELDPDKPDAAREAPAHGMDSALATELDDALMAELLEEHRRVRAAGDNPGRLMALRTGTRWDSRRYGRAMLKWRVMQEAVRKGADKAQREIDELVAGLAKTDEERESVSGAPREQRERTLLHSRAMESTRLERLKALRQLDTPETRVFVAKWKPRFAALDEEYD